MADAPEDTFKWLSSFLIPEYCYLEFFVKLNIFHDECLKILISKGLGILIVFGSALVKFPQVIKIIGSGSVTGLSASGQLLELSGVTCTLAYGIASGFPFSAYGEALFLMLQTGLILILILLYKKQKLATVSFLTIYMMTTYLLCSGITPISVLTSLQTVNIPLIVGGKLTQVLANYRQGSTGQLSAITVFLLTGGSMARIFTSIQETGDMVMIVTFVLSSLANLLLAIQIVYYWNTPASAAADKRPANVKGKKDEKMA